MKIAINTRFLLENKLEGIGWYTHEMVRRMVLRHPEHTFYFLFDRPFSEQFLYAENVKPLVIFPPARHAILWYWWFEWSLPRIFKKIKPDVFYSPDGYCSLRAKVPTVLTIHDLAPLHFPEQVSGSARLFYQHYLGKYATRAEAITAVSNFTKHDITAVLGTPESKITPIFNGCRSSFMRENITVDTALNDQFSSGKPYFFYYGAIHPRKNIVHLLRAFDWYKSQTGSEVKLILAGRMAWKTDEITRQAANSAYKNDIIFTGFLTEAALSSLLAGALALVYVSLFEGFGLPILEALHAEVPVICSNTSSMPEVAGKAALLVDPNNPVAIGEAMVKMAADPALRLSLVEIGREQRHQFDWDRAAETLLELIVQTAK